MGWVIMGIILFVLLNKSKGCRSYSHRKCLPRRARARHSRPSVSETYRRQAEAEDMKRRMRVFERALDPRDDRLRRDIQNL